MKACGVIVEYNPFHNGHRYHAQQARKRSGAEVVVACMSGNFLQRGEPAIIDKWLRTEAALKNGVDLVIELPLCWSLQAADFFARGSIKLLQGIGCESLCFGTDAEDRFDYQEFGNLVTGNQLLIDQTYQQLQDEKLSYPQKMNQVYSQLFADMQLAGDTPNHILGLAYAKENAAYPHPMKLISVPRIGSGYNESNLRQGQLASGTGIREGVRSGANISSFVPPKTAWGLTQQSASWEGLWPYLRYRLLAAKPEELRRIYQMTEGLEHRLIEAAKQALDFQQFMAQVKSKRYTWTRLQRLFCYVLLDINNQEMQAAWQENQLRVLGFTEIGQRYLSQQKKKLTFPLVTRVGKAQNRQQELTLRSDEIYRLADPRIPEQAVGRIPIRV